jgi:uncharacterized protein YndB with AHSA1/START domain
LRIHESIIIAADADAVWPLIADPVRQADWNGRIVSVDRNRSGPAGQGDRFDMIFRMSGRDRKCRVDVIECDRPNRIAFRYSMTFKDIERIMEVSFDITSQPGGVRVDQIDQFTKGIPWLARVVMWLVNRFGWQAEEPHLGRLKKLAEHSHSAASADSSPVR